MAEFDKEFVEYVIKAIVEYPDDVKVDRKVDERGVLIELSINPNDMGKVIGKEGRTAKSLRTLLRVLGAKNNARINLKIVEPEGSIKPRATSKKEDEPEEATDSKKEDEPEEATEVM